MSTVAGAILEIVQIKNGVKTENAIEKNCVHCYECELECRKGLLSKIKPYGFTLFVKRYGETLLLDCLERNEKKGIVYHRERINGDYDNFDDVEKLINFIRAGEK